MFKFRFKFIIINLLIFIKFIKLEHKYYKENKNENINYWRCGFIGTNLALYLSKKGFKVSSLDNLSRKGSKYNSTLLKRIKFEILILIYLILIKLKKLPKYDLIIDCCAEAAVEISKKDIDKVINTNLIGTFNILKKIKKDTLI